MSLARIVFCLAIGGMASLAVASVRAADAESVLKTVEGEIAHAAQTDPEKQGTATDPLSVDPDLAVWTVVVFVVLLLVLKKFAWGPILHALEAREQNIANHIAEAQRNHEEAKRLLVQYEQKLALAAGEVRELMEEARHDAERAKQVILAEAKAEAAAERHRSLHDIETAADQAMESLAHRAAQLAVDLAGKILQAQLSTADHARLIEEAVAKFPASTPSAN